MVGEVRDMRGGDLQKFGWLVVGSVSCSGRAVENSKERLNRFSSLAWLKALSH